MEFIMISVGGRQEYVENAMFNLSLDSLEDCREICHCTIHSKKTYNELPMSTHDERPSSKHNFECFYDEKTTLLLFLQSLC